MNEVVLTQSGSFDFRNLSEVELEVIVQVIQKDFEIKASEKARLRRHRRKLKEADERVSILASSNFNESFCVICFKRFVLLFYPKHCCLSCRHCMCRDCAVWIPRDKKYMCLLCQNERTLKSMACDWYYGLLKNRFQHDASELVAQSLYSNQGQYSLITPDILQKVKGVQISRYRQKIQCKWEEMQERLRRLDLSEINRVKREESYVAINEEYKSQFKEVLKEFSQVLYITLENYAAKTRDVCLNINEQVMDTVHEEVELLIGYKINLIPEEMQSVISDVESTASMFMGNQLEERLAVALINKINEDHHKVYDYSNYDVGCLDQIRSDDQWSTTTSLYRANQGKSTTVTNGTRGSSRSSMTASHTMEVKKTVPTEYATDTRDSSTYGANSDFNNEGEMMSEVALSAKQVQHIMKYPNKESASLTERHVNVPLGEPINLLVELNGVSKIDINWSKNSAGRKVVLKNGTTTEIITSAENQNTSSNLRIWDCKKHDAGVYIALVNNRPIAAFMVKVIDSDHTPARPMFRLKMINSTIREGQSAVFSVEAVGHPEPRLVFYHNNTILNIPSNKYSLEHVANIKRVSLKINRVGPMDKGVYRCVASNEIGSCECSADLQVTSQSLRFENRKPAYSSGSSIDDETVIPQVHVRPDFKDQTDCALDSNTSVNQLVEIHQHLAYLEWQLDWFEEQTLQGALTSPTSELSIDLTSDTVIGRELPDDVTQYSPMTSARQLNTFPRSNSVDSQDSGDVSPRTARSRALKTGIFSHNGSSSNVARIREIFSQPSLSPTHLRSPSITNRTPLMTQRRPDIRLTREVRIRRSNSVNE